MRKRGFSRESRSSTGRFFRTCSIDRRRGQRRKLKISSKFSDLQQVADYNTAFMNLEAGAVDAIVVDIGVADYQLESRTGFAMLDDKIRTEQYAVGFKLGNEELRDQVQSTLDEMVKDGTFDDIEKMGFIRYGMSW